MDFGKQQKQVIDSLILVIKVPDSEVTINHVTLKNNLNEYTVICTGYDGHLKWSYDNPFQAVMRFLKQLKCVTHV